MVDKITATHILVDTKIEAIKILSELKSGKNFENLASAYSICPSKEKGGNLGEFTRGMMVKEFSKAAFNLEVGEIYNKSRRS